MRRILAVLLLTALAVPAFATGRRGVTMSIDDGDDPAECSDIRVTFDGERVPTATEEVTAAAALNSLRVKSHEHGGIRVTGWSGRTLSVLACKAIAPGANADAVRVALNGNELSTSGPGNRGWVVYYLIRAPRGASLDLETSNGPLAIDGVNANVTARVTNGPLSVKDSTGRIDVSAENGPVAISGGTGDIKARATNGPIAVSLKGTAWQGSLNASSENGPAAISVPRGYRSRVTIQAMGGAPITCSADECRSISMFDGDTEPRNIHLGSGPTNVHITAENGPLSIQNN